MDVEIQLSLEIKVGYRMVNMTYIGICYGFHETAVDLVKFGMYYLNVGNLIAWEIGGRGMSGNDVNLPKR